MRLSSSITVEEIWDAIKSFILGKVPGPDGFSIELYLLVFPIIKDDMVILFNKFFETGFIPAKNKKGLISLIPKKEPLWEIENYRPINLINVDLKIYAKVLCSRMKPFLSLVLNESQYAQPDKNIMQLVTLMRDINYEMGINTSDSFLISLDFEKAFDNVNHKYIEKVLSRMHFPAIFIKAFKSLYKNASSKLIINGGLSKRISIKSGIRQGCPFSRDIFTLTINPLIEYLASNESIISYISLSRQQFLSLAFVDDLNVILQCLKSVFNVLHAIRLFGNISGFRLNHGKTKGIFYNNRNNIQVSALPQITWVENLTILGVNFGTDAWRNEQWNDKLLDYKKDIVFFKTKKPTLDAKAMLCKFKLCSVFSYLGQVYPVPENVGKKIDDCLLSFIVPHKKTFMDITDFALPRHYGGYGFSNINLNLKLLYVKPIMQYVNEKVNHGSLSKEMYYIEYNLGQQLSLKFGLPINNVTPHAFKPNDFYKRMFDIICLHKITLDELMEGKVISIYKRIMTEIGEFRGRNSTENYGKLHRNIFPNYLKTFNYKLQFDLLPVKGKFYEHMLDADVKVTCPFCNINLESAVHIFAKCKLLSPLWDFIDQVLIACFSNKCNYRFKDSRMKKYDYSLVWCKCQNEYESLILYVNAVVNHNLWKLRNKVFHECAHFDIVQLINNIIGSVRARKTFEPRLKHCNNIPFIDDFLIALCSVRDAMYDPG